MTLTDPTNLLTLLPVSCHTDSFGEMVRLVEALRTQGVEFQQLVFPDEIHGFLRHRTWLAAYRAASDFFDQHLKKRAAPGSPR